MKSKKNHRNELNKKIEIERGIEIEKEYQANPGKVTESYHKFDKTIQPGSGWIAVSKHGYKLGVKVTTNYSIISPTGKVMKRRDRFSNTSHQDINDLIYIQKQKSFFIHESFRKEIWKVSLNDFEPKLWMTDFKVVLTHSGDMFKEVLNGRALAILKSPYKITLIEINQDGSKGRVIDNQTAKYTTDIEVGEGNSGFLVGLSHGPLMLYKIKDDLTIKYVSKFNLSSGVKKEDYVQKIAVSPNTEYVFVHSCNPIFKAANQLIILVNGGDFKLCAVLDLTSENLNDFHAIDYLKTVGDELIFKGFSNGQKSPVLTLMYNKRTNVFQELADHRMIIKDHSSNNVKKQGDVLYLIGHNDSKLLKIT